VLLAKLPYMSVAHLAASTWEQKLIAERDDLANLGTQYKLACDFFKAMEELASKKNLGSHSNPVRQSESAGLSHKFRRKQKTAKPWGSEPPGKE
jgi:hypothetical protein